MKPASPPPNENPAPGRSWMRPPPPPSLRAPRRIQGSGQRRSGEGSPALLGTSSAWSESHPPRHHPHTRITRGIASGWSSPRPVGGYHLPSVSPYSSRPQAAQLPHGRPPTSLRTIVPTQLTPSSVTHRSSMHSHYAQIRNISNPLSRASLNPLLRNAGHRFGSESASRHDGR